MSTTPPRRSRPKPPSGGSSLPFIPIFIGVVVLGFVIGAGISVMGRHGSSDRIANATSSPFAEATDADEATAVPTPIPGVPKKAVLATPVLEATSTPSPRPSESAHASAKPSVRPQATKDGAMVANASDTASPPAPEFSPTPAQTALPLATAATHRPAPAAPAVAPASAPVSAAPSAATSAPPPPAAAAAVDADGAFSTLAGNVVKQYLLSISRGDTDSAYAALGDGPGSHPDSVPEIGAVDSTMHIQKIQARGSDTSATVNVDLTTANGPYYGQYTVHKSATGAAIIVSHTFGKP